MVYAIGRHGPRRFCRCNTGLIKVEDPGSTMDRHGRADLIKSILCPIESVDSFTHVCTYLSHTTIANRVRSVAQLRAYVGEAVHTLGGTSMPMRTRRAGVEHVVHERGPLRTPFLPHLNLV